MVAIFSRGRRMNLVNIAAYTRFLPPRDQENAVGWGLEVILYNWANDMLAFICIRRKSEQIIWYCSLQNVAALFRPHYNIFRLNKVLEVKSGIGITTATDSEYNFP